MAIVCVGYITDPHIPFHSAKALSVALSVLHDSNISSLILGGDVLDMYWANAHGPKHPEIAKGFLHEIEEGNNFLDLIDKTWPDIPKHYVEGNHETRFERFLIKNCRELFGITEVKFLLDMHKRPKWTYHGYGPRQLMQVGKSDLYAKHAPAGSSGGAIMNKSACNLIFGHIHRIIDEHRVTADGRRLHVVSPGWLGDIKYDQVFGYVAGHHGWQQGFARIWIDTDTNEFWIDVHQIKDGRCVVDGKLYKG